MSRPDEDHSFVMPEWHANTSTKTLLKNAKLLHKYAKTRLALQSWTQFILKIQVPTNLNKLCQAIVAFLYFSLVHVFSKHFDHYHTCKKIFEKNCYKSTIDFLYCIAWHTRADEESSFHSFRYHFSSRWEDYTQRERSQKRKKQSPTKY